MENRTTQVHPFILSTVSPLQVVFQNLSRADEDVISLHNLGKRDFELGVSADSLHFVFGF